MAEWYLYALATMLLFSFANIALKAILTDEAMKLLGDNKEALLYFVGFIAVAAVAAYFLFLRKLPLPQNTLLLAIGFTLLASLGFVFLLFAVSSGKIAPVTAILSTSSIMVAVLSIVLLKDALTVNELAGIALAFVGVLLLVFK